MAKKKEPKRQTKRKRGDDNHDDSVLIRDLSNPKDSRPSVEVRAMARYNAFSPSYFQLVSIEHRDSFTLKSMTVPDGSLAGRKVIVLEPIQCFRFLDLPAELRNNIYELLFPEQSPMRKSGKNIRLYHSRPGFKTTSRNRERDNKNDILRVSMRPPSNLVANVLSVCRQVLHEAAPIAYASSTFCGELGPLNAFLLAAGGMCDSLQHLEVLPGAKLEASSVWSGIGTTLTRLASSRMLRNITIPHRAVCACRDKLRFGEPFRVPYYLDRHVRGFCQGKTASGANAALSCIRVLTETCCNCSASNHH